MKSELDAVRAFLGFEEANGPTLQSEVRAAQTTDPRSNEPVLGLTTSVLWCGDQPVAARIGPVVLVNLSSRRRSHRELVAGEAASLGLEVRHVREPDLWRLALAPRPGRSLPGD
jgi:hypothetical protein